MKAKLANSERSSSSAIASTLALLGSQFSCLGLGLGLGLGLELELGLRLGLGLGLMG